jgi:DNA-binding SARP family transcriptional activator
MVSRVLRVRLLGGVDLRLGDEPLPPLDSARVESLLAYLLLHRDAPQPRQRLAFLLWPDSTEAQARTNLRKVLHNLRRALPDADRFIDVGPRTLQWRPDAPLWLDVERFEQALADSGSSRRRRRGRCTRGSSSPRTPRNRPRRRRSWAARQSRRGWPPCGGRLRAAALSWCWSAARRASARPGSSTSCACARTR